MSFAHGRSLSGARGGYASKQWRSFTLAARATLRDPAVQGAPSGTGAPEWYRGPPVQEGSRVTVLGPQSDLKREARGCLPCLVTFYII